MRFGISATSWIFPKNLRTRLRPVNVCAISSLSLSRCRTVGPGTTLRKAAIHRDHQDNRREPFSYAIRLVAEALTLRRRPAEIWMIPEFGHPGISCTQFTLT